MPAHWPRSASAALPQLRRPRSSWPLRRWALPQATSYGSSLLKLCMVVL